MGFVEFVRWYKDDNTNAENLLTTQDYCVNEISNSRFFDLMKFDIFPYFIH